MTPTPMALALACALLCGTARAQDNTLVIGCSLPLSGEGANGKFAIDPATRDIDRFDLTTVRVENGKIDYKPKS